MVFTKRRDREPTRQGQQNRRGRGRNRKGQNPLTRSFESNGPDMKIRGTPAHVAEKYTTLARDAQSAGDPVLAENYLQHAEHYNRIILTYREQQAGEAANSNTSRQRGGQPGETQDSGVEFSEDDAEDTTASANAPDQLGEPQSGQPRGDRRPRGPRARRNDNSTGNGEQPDVRRSQHGDDRDEGSSRPRRRTQRADRSESEQFGNADDQPEFLRRPIRRPRRNADAGATGDDQQPSKSAAPVIVDEAND